MDVWTPAHLPVISHTCRAHLCRVPLSGCRGVAGSSSRHPLCHGRAGRGLVSTVHRLGVGNQGSKQPEGCCTWNGMLRLCMDSSGFHVKSRCYQALHRCLAPPAVPGAGG